MSEENKNLKDSERKSSFSHGAGPEDMSLIVSYTKTNKLITALYMVTDIIDKEEPIRTKLRNLGAEIISDIHSVPKEANNKIAETVSFLNIASAMNLISEMNCSILKKEFSELKASIQESADMRPIWLADFFDSNNAFPPPLSGEDSRRGFNSPHPNPLLSKERENVGFKGHSNGHQISTRIGVQKGSTLLNAIKDISNKIDFDLLKKERRFDIVKIIKAFDGGLRIKDIKDKIKTTPEIFVSLVSCSEKTLQRELISMVKDGVLNKIGEKRWSRYFLKN